LGEFLGTVLLLVVLYGCERWSEAFREEQRAEENRPRMDKITGGWRKKIMRRLISTVFFPEYN
jgi:hypothetical protein